MGLTPARPGIKPGEGIRHTYSSIAEAVGEQNIFYIGYDQDALRDYDTLRGALETNLQCLPDSGGALRLGDARCACRKPLPGRDIPPQHGMALLTVILASQRSAYSRSLPIAAGSGAYDTGQQFTLGNFGRLVQFAGFGLVIWELRSSSRRSPP